MTVGPTVSVVTPVYNGQRYLEECIQSVLRQSYRDFEYLVVDNRSTDDTAVIAERYAELDSRIRVLRAREFVSVHANHNRALELMDSRSRYCKIVHADDWLYPECLERMVTLAESHPSVGVVSAYRLEDTRVEHDGLLPYWQNVIPGNEVVRRALLGPHWVTGSPTSLLFRAALFRDGGCSFDETVWHSDTDVAYRGLLRSELGFVHQVLTFTRMHADALTSFSLQVNTYLANEGRMLIRHGPRVLSPGEYRTRMRGWLSRYAWYLAKQAVKPSRYGDRSFHGFHRREVGHMLAEARGDRESRIVLSLCRHLLRVAPRA